MYCCPTMPHSVLCVCMHASSGVALRTLMREILPMSRAMSRTLVCLFCVEGEVAEGSLHGLLGSGE